MTVVTLRWLFRKLFLQRWEEFVVHAAILKNVYVGTKIVEVGIIENERKDQHTNEYNCSIINRSSYLGRNYEK